MNDQKQLESDVVTSSPSKNNDMNHRTSTAADCYARAVRPRLIAAKQLLVDNLFSRAGMVKLKDRIVGLVRSRNWVEWTFFVLGSLALNAALSATGSKILSGIPSDTPDLTFAIIIFINSMFCTTFVNSCMMNRRQEHAFHFILSYVTVVLYCFFNYIQSHDKGSYKLGRLCTLTACLPILLPLAAWLCCFYHSLPRDPPVTSAHNFAGYTRSLVVLDTQMEISAWLLLLKDGISAPPGLWIIFSIGLGCAISKLALSSIAVLKCNRNCLYAALALCALEPVVVAYKFYEAATNPITTILTPLTYLVGTAALLVHAATVGVLTWRAVTRPNGGGGVDAVPEFFECCFGVANQSVSTQTLDTSSVLVVEDDDQARPMSCEVQENERNSDAATNRFPDAADVVFAQMRQNQLN